ncbi:PaaX domain-containing protein, C- domain protein [Nonomuraea sp. SBT364]|uniref:PaaX domain-containing protein, C- domain protein n=1 Tax=Nonomuraea sp. SBT364 TaxID=1580530 RepID=UPI000B0F475B|nr:PaaX domain-containing protein, C- domain protein [Nonomuraea sp. SBT364]
MEERNGLSARSAVLSALLGSHPPSLPARRLVRIGALFGIAEGTVRVALSRMVGAGDLTQAGGLYTLSERLVERQARQDESRAPHTRPWDGTWEIAVVTAERRAPADRAAFRHTMTALRLAELREGTWMRPANLLRAWPESVAAQCTLIDGRPHGDPTGLLWDLEGWTAEAHRLERALDGALGRRTGWPRGSWCRRRCCATCSPTRCSRRSCCRPGGRAPACAPATTTSTAATGSSSTATSKNDPALQE